MRGVQVELTLDAPRTTPEVVIAGVLKRHRENVHRALRRSGGELIASYGQRVIEMRPEHGSYWPTHLQYQAVEDLLAGLLTDLEAQLLPALESRLALDLAATVAPRLTPSREEQS